MTKELERNSHSKIRVLHCIETISSGGVEKVRLGFAQYLNKEKFDLRIICTNSKGPIKMALEKEGVQIYDVGPFNSPFEWGKYRKVLSIISTYKPQIIHGAVYEGMSMAAVGGFLGRVPIIILEETSDPQNRSKKAIWLQKQFSKVADKVIGISPSVVNFLLDKARIPKEKVLLVNNGVSIPLLPDKMESDLLKRKLGIENGDIIIGSVGRVYNEVKRFSDLLEAIKGLKNPKVKFLLVGQGPDLEKLKSRASELGLEGQFISVGYQENTSTFYSVMDIFSLPSANEGFGLVAAEAMLHSLPIVATAVGGLRDVVIDGTTGFHVPPFSPNDLGEKLQILIDNQELRAQMGKAGFERAKKNYTSELYCQNIEQLYINLLNEIIG
ncbi:glycosyltransferase [Aquiflexum gelatinilyticum]|uniref:Glycosyltransferase n=1 Tax=Aquiflexum gelatinilyticum TaxID=2961943 RepID=A0A9X2SZT4_9BACT|nr:glycosyltransferase [Aquiflexum gelatinilyticum]MCR9014853.1 glycosyltransferase [Aquiflexum gelatinilyticum]